MTPTRLTIRAYAVGFGDCFLLTFHYGGATGDRHMLIDFGSTQLPANAGRDRIQAIAKDIQRVVGTQLHVLVATHRHSDHISGFATRADGQGPGDRIAQLNPALVIQPWTERPDAPEDWQGPASGPVGDAALTSSLALMRQVAAVSVQESRSLQKSLRDEVRFLAEDGLSNLSAVKNLARMAKRGQGLYVSHGTRIPVSRLLPGIKITVLGPPTLRQKADIANQKATNSQEYWQFRSFWQLRAGTAALGANGTALFPAAATYPPGRFPPESRWFIGRVKRMRGGQLLRIVRAMDDALNNTSVILLIQAGKKRLLFPGDAQWENWEYALKKNAAALRNVDIYKVGHHGSLNATPRSLWNRFARRAEAASAPRRLCTLLSTRSDSKHGHPERGTEVPRQTLLQELRKFSVLRSTQELESAGALDLTLDVDLTG